MHRRCPLWWVRVLLVVVSVELSLQLGAAGYRWWTASTRISQVEEGEFTILCLGDSNTFGLGAAPQDSYPRQLEGFFAVRWPERRILVVNAGKPGGDSTTVLDQLAGHLDAVRPDLILLLIGVNDGGNMHAVNFTSVERLGLPWKTRLKMWLDQWLLDVRLYRLVKSFMILPSEWAGRMRAHTETESTSPIMEHSPDPLLAELDHLLKERPTIAEKVRQIVGPDPNQPHDEALSGSEALLESTSGNSMGLARLSNLFFEIGRTDISHQLDARALAMVSSEEETLLVQAEIAMGQRALHRAQFFFEQLIEQDPTNPDFYVKLSGVQLEQGAIDEAIASARTAVTLDPEFAPAYHRLGDAFRFQQNWEQAKAMYHRAVELEPMRQMVWFRLAEIYETEEPPQIDAIRHVGKKIFFQSDFNNLTGFRMYGQGYEDPEQAREAMRTLLKEAKAASPHHGPAFWQPHERLIQGGVLPEVLYQERVLKANLEQIIDQVTAQGVRLGLLTYAQELGDNVANQWIREAVATHPEVLLIDAYRALSDRFKDPEADLLTLNVDGSHPNGKGYGLLARYVMETLVAAGIL